MLKLTNTLTGQKEFFEPLKNRVVTVYTCGPTVYLESHIGNWRTFIFYDTLARTLKYLGYNVHNVLNITDVGHLTSDSDEGEDKIEQEARIERETAWEIAQKYTQLFKTGLRILNIQEPWKMPKATDHIKQQIALIKTLEDKGATYLIKGDGIYFDTSCVKDYGKLAKFDKDAQRAGARVDFNSHKKHHADFALWKFSPANKQRDMEWDSPWGKGFPGWHIECSAMANEYLGPTLDIHAGGIDHIGTHHTNEIAQSETATGKPYVKIWLHAQFMQINNTKMAKSKGNWILLKDIQHLTDPMVFRLLVLSSHYATAQKFDIKTLKSFEPFLLKLYGFADRQYQLAQLKPVSKVKVLFNKALKNFKSAMEDDLNTAKALAVISNLIDDLEDLPITKNDNQLLLDSLGQFEAVLGLKLLNRKDINPEIKKLIQERDFARKNGDYKKADQLRMKLLNNKIAIKDLPFESRWQKMSFN